MSGLRSKAFSIIDKREPFEWFVQALAVISLISLVWISRAFLDLFGSGGAIRQEIFLDISQEAPFSVWTLLRKFHLLQYQDLTLKIAYGAVMLGCVLAFFRPRDWRCLVFYFFAFVFIKQTMMGAVYGLYEFLHIGLLYSMLWSLTQAKWVQANGFDQARLARLVGLGFQIHLAIAYFYTGISKGIGKQWQTGEAMWRAMYRSDSTGTRLFDLTFLGHWPWLLQIMCFSVVVFETLYFLAFFRKCRLVVVVALIGMHIGIMLAFGLWLFGATMIIHNLFFYAHARWLEKQVEKDGSLLAAIGLRQPTVQMETAS